MFKKRTALDPLHVDQTRGEQAAEIQDNDPGPTALDLEAVARAEGDLEARKSGPSRISYNPGSFQPRKVLEIEPKDD